MSIGELYFHVQQLIPSHTACDDTAIINKSRVRFHTQPFERDIAHRETEIYRRELSGRIEALVMSVDELRHSLDPVSSHFDRDEEVVSTLLFSYEEGWISLSELLAGFQIEMTGMQDYYRQLTDYYSSIFELEAITGLDLVSFDP